MEYLFWHGISYFFYAAIIAHNIPEGAAIGIGFQTEHHVGVFLSIALAIHNIPEGMGLAVPLIAAKRHPITIIGLSMLCSGMLPLGTWLGISLLTQSVGLVSIGLIFAAVTMVWIAVYEICPRAFALHKFISFWGLGIGALFMYIIHFFH
jgi:zinc transporter, ZIP family